MKTIAENANDFADLRTLDGGNCIYVDKTDYFHRLVTDPGRRLFFIARPRRFGKSLMITTFKYIFEGRRELFKGLKIDGTDYDWKVHPVIHLDFSFCAARTHAELMEGLPANVEDALIASGATYDKSQSPAVNLGRAIDCFHAKGTPCVILIDEYDDPVAKALGDPAEAEKVRDELAKIYGQFKGRTNKIRFLMITGVSKFTKMSVFSALSNLSDISPMSEYAAMLGYTEEELDEYFGEHMAAHAKVMGLSDAAYRAELKRWYNGYRFSADDPVTVYNPVSIGLTLANPRVEFHGTWTQTGRASTLMNYIKREGAIAVDLDGTISAGEGDFDVSDLTSLSPIGMLYQTGYLTIADYSDGLYRLRVPDEEVKRDIASLVAGAYADRDARWSASLGIKLRAGLWDEFFDGLKALYAKLPYGSREQGERKSEFNYQRPLCALIAAQGFRYAPEAAQTAGRSDLVAEHPSGIYVFELKVDESAAAALDQIRRKGYAEPYRARGLPIWAVGLNFDSRTRHLTDAAVERIS